MSEIPAVSREWHLVRRPQGWPVAEDFALREVPVAAEPAPGRILVRNLHMSVDPYMRGRMNDVKSYVPPFQLDKPMDGGAVGEVVASSDERFAVGDHVLHGLGWREYADVDAKHATKVDGALAPLSAYLGVLGMPGLTAYAGLFEVASFKEGDSVFVSGAAGAVGSLVGQFAKIKGASQVIGSMRSDEKVTLLTEKYGFDAAFNYKNGPVGEQLKEAAPEGIDVYFDNVGGDHLEAAISSLKVHGRATLCGAIAQYNATEPTPVRATSPWSSASACGCRASWSATTPASSSSSSRTWRDGCAPESCGTTKRSSRASRTRPLPSSACCAVRTPER